MTEAWSAPNYDGRVAPAAAARACPRCKSHRGKPCMTRSGHIAQCVHKARIHTDLERAESYQPGWGASRIQLSPRSPAGPGDPLGGVAEKVCVVEGRRWTSFDTRSPGDLWTYYPPSFAYEFYIWDHPKWLTRLWSTSGMLKREIRVESAEAGMALVALIEARAGLMWVLQARMHDRVVRLERSYGDQIP